jgi:signal transduction histidine kinase
MRGRFLWRIGAFLGVLIIVMAVVFTIAFWVASHIAGGPPHRGFFRVGAIVWIVVLTVGIAAGRMFRRAVLPIGDVMEAAQRVADGDYSVRVGSRGPAEVRALSDAFNTMADRLQATDERRRSLLAEISHDLRTPLAVIQGNLEGLLDGVYPRDDAHLIMILEETRHLVRLVEDLRTLALAESGALKLQREPTDLGALTAETVASFQGQAVQAGLTLVAEIPSDLPVVEVDPVRIRQVLENVIVNALGFTPAGGEVRVHCYLASPPGERKLAVDVSDTGPGIAPEDLPHIFDRFYKSKESRGSGLGLTIARNLVVAHGGAIVAHSEVGQGTTIRIRLPLASH